MSETKSALIIASYQYQHPELRQLLAPARDAESLARVLGDPAIGGFEVRTLINEPSYKVSGEIEGFFYNRKPDDLLLLYFSGHGIKDFDGRLYFATTDTQLVDHNVRRTTAVSSQFVNEVMGNCRSKRQILLLDCCYSGAFKDGMLAKGDGRAGATEQFEGKGRIVLTASDALQYSFEEEGVKGEATRSVFTSALVEGLETGKADLDHDGSYALDEVYDYVYSRVSEKEPGQKPMKMGYVEGKIFLGNNPHPAAAQLPEELRESLEDRRPWVRLGAVSELEKLLASSHKGLVLAAQAALASLATTDDSLEVRKAAEQRRAARADAATGQLQEDKPPERNRVEVEDSPEGAPGTAPQPAPRKSNYDQTYYSPPRMAERKAAAAAATQGETPGRARVAEERLAAEKPEQQRPAPVEVERAAQATAAALAYVPPSRRALADLIDWGVVFLALVALVAALPNNSQSGSQILGFFVIVAALGFAFHLHKTGKTLGHSLMGTRIVDRRGNPLTYLRSLAFVVVWCYCSWLPFPGLGTAIFVRYTRRHAALYDLIAGTSARSG
ncbi:MAG TPA: caspase family protein [Bryobacteraceae bacterium]|jgi:uncharacterized RDD family membrane protein YckC